MQNTEITINDNTNTLKIPGEMGGDVLINIDLILKTRVLLHKSYSNLIYSINFGKSMLCQYRAMEKA